MSRAISHLSEYIEICLNNFRSTPYRSADSEVNNRVRDRIGYRKLMQVDEEDNEELNYEDVKEVLTDNRQNDDDFDRQTEKRKRESVIFVATVAVWL